MSVAPTPVQAQWLPDSLYSLSISVDSFRTVRNKTIFSFVLDNSGKLSLKGWNPPLRNVGSTAGPADVIISSSDSATTRMVVPLTISSLFIEDLNVIDKAIRDNNAKFVIFVPNISNGQLNYAVYVGQARPKFSPTIPSGLVPTGAELNPSPPYSDQ